VWQLVVEFDLVDRAFLPSFGETLSALWEMTRNGEIGFNLLVSIYRAFAGPCIGLLPARLPSMPRVCRVRSHAGALDKPGRDRGRDYSFALACA
jgi:hypothetical protein